MAKFTDRLVHAWDAFRGRDHPEYYYHTGVGYGENASWSRYTNIPDTSIISTVRTRIATEVASTAFKHVRVDENSNFQGVINSDLNYCLTVEANKDQTSREFFQDIAESMLEEGTVAVVPTQTDTDPRETNIFKIKAMRVGKIFRWYPDYVEVELYNGHTGMRERRVYPKRMVGIVTNPFYSIMNLPNSTAQRLQQRLQLLDIIDDRNGIGKLKMLIQLPYSVRSPQKRAEANQHIKDIDENLANSKHGIAYIDNAEKVIPIGAPIENNILEQVDYFTTLLFNQLGLTNDIFNGTADEQQMLNYNNRTIEPIVSAITDELSRKFISKTARSQGQTIMAFKKPFKFVTDQQLGEIVNTFSRNAIITPNEVRGIVGLMPAQDANSDKLLNRNMPLDEQVNAANNPEGPAPSGDPMDIPFSDL